MPWARHGWISRACTISRWGLAGGVFGDQPRLRARQWGFGRPRAGIVRALLMAVGLYVLTPNSVVSRSIVSGAEPS